MVINVRYPRCIDESGHTAMRDLEERVTSVE